jgi:hypothetical protein
VSRAKVRRAGWQALGIAAKPGRAATRVAAFVADAILGLSRHREPMTSDICPRCGRAFACGMNAAAPCACTGVTLSPALLERLRREHAGCLCVACLAELCEQEKGRPVSRPAGPA